MKKSIVFANFCGVKRPTESTFSYYSKPEAVKRALNSLGICWGVAIVCIAIPILHFVLTPAMLLAGPVAGFLVYGRVQKLPKLIEGTVNCVHCHNTSAFNLKDVKPPLYETCGNCKTGYEILWPPQET